MVRQIGGSVYFLCSSLYFLHLVGHHLWQRLRPRPTIQCLVKKKGHKKGVCFATVALPVVICESVLVYSFLGVCVCNLFPFLFLCVKTLCFHTPFYLWICRESAAGEIEATVN